MKYLIEWGDDGALIRREVFDREKLAEFLHKLEYNLDFGHLNISLVIDKVSAGLPKEFTRFELYDLLSECIAARVIYHPDYALLAGRVEASKLQKITPKKFSENVEVLNAHKQISDKFYRTVMKNKELYDKIVCPSRDYELSYFGIKTLQNSYLLSCNKKIQETPQYMFLRVSIEIHGESLDEVKETYDLMSQKYFVHASPTLFNSGMEYNYLSSCFLVGMEEDSIDGIYKTLHKTALISKAAGGIGLHVHNIRARGSRIGVNGTSNGLVPMLRVFNNTARYVDQGGNKRPGAMAIYIEPWHADIFDVLNLKKNHGKEEMRTRDLFFGLWIPDLFMKRVKNNLDWTLFSPDTASGLADCHGEEFVKLYEKYESQGLGKKIKAQKLWHSILEAQTETGGPYMMFKDACNLKSNQQNLGTIKSSNLCCEIVEYSAPEEIAVCNLGSIGLPSYVTKTVVDGKLELGFDFHKLHQVAKVLTRNLNKVIDVTKYPLETTKVSNKRHRPIALGVQGLADLFCELRLPFDSPEARSLNVQIFETIYHAALQASAELAAEDGPYETFSGSPASEGKLQFDLWNHKPTSLYDWDALKDVIKQHGLRNSLLVAPMPTASTSQILGYNECFEPFTSNIYTRRVLSGEYQVVNKYLLQDLVDLGLWSSAMKDKILHENGSIQNISSIPEDLKKLYRTVWEIPQKAIIEMASDRGKFIDQSQSMNIYMPNPTFGKLTSCHFYAWEKGLKTGMYYLRTQAASRAIQFTVNVEELNSFGPEVSNTLSRGQYKARTEPIIPNDEWKGKIEMLKPITPDMGTPNFDKSERRNSANSNLGSMDRHISEEAPNKKRKYGPFYTPQSNSHTPTASSSPESYDIYDETVLSCDIKNPENCESCSG